MLREPKRRPNKKPRLIAYNTKQGGDWIKWTSSGGSIQMHAILFQDGSIWDLLNGWRPQTSWYTQLRIRQIRNLWRNKNAPLSDGKASRVLPS